MLVVHFAFPQKAGFFSFPKSSLAIFTAKKAFPPFRPKPIPSRTPSQKSFCSFLLFLVRRRFSTFEEEEANINHFPKLRLGPGKG